MDAWTGSIIAKEENPGKISQILTGILTLSLFVV